MAATKRNAGLTSAVHRATLNDEELVSIETFPKETNKRNDDKVIIDNEIDMLVTLEN
jgi:hypothetical protein